MSNDKLALIVEVKSSGDSDVMKSFADAQNRIYKNEQLLSDKLVSAVKAVGDFLKYFNPSRNEGVHANRVNNQRYGDKVLGGIMLKNLQNSVVGAGTGAAAGKMTEHIVGKTASSGGAMGAGLTIFFDTLINTGIDLFKGAADELKRNSGAGQYKSASNNKGNGLSGFNNLDKPLQGFALLSHGVKNTTDETVKLTDGVSVLTNENKKNEKSVIRQSKETRNLIHDNSNYSDVLLSLPIKDHTYLLDNAGESMLDNAVYSEQASGAYSDFSLEVEKGTVAQEKNKKETEASRDSFDGMAANIDSFSSSWGAAFDALGGSVGKTMSGIMGGLSKGVGAVKGFIGGIQSGLGSIDKIGGLFSKSGGMGGLAKGFGGIMGKDGPLGKAFGAISGIASKLGPIGAGIAAAIPAISGLIKGIKSLFGGKSDWDRIRDYTREFADDLGPAFKGIRKQMLAYSKTLKGKNKAQRAFNNGLSDMVSQANIGADSFEKYAKKVHNIFREYDKGTQSLKETQKYMGSAFAALASKQKELGGHYSAEMKSIIKDVEKRGMKIAEVTEYINKRQAEGLVGYKEMIKELDSSAVGEQIETLEKRMRGMKEGSDEFVAAQEQLSGLKSKYNDINSAMEVFGGVSIGLFDEMIAKEERLAANKELINKYKSFETSIIALTDTTDISQEKFNSFSSVLGNSYSKMMEGGMTSKDALEQMAPSLTRIIELSNAHGYTIDANTQKMIDEAQAAGVSLTKQIEPQEKMVVLLESIATKFGAEIPYAAEEMANKVNNKFDEVGSKGKKALDQATGEGEEGEKKTGALKTLGDTAVEAKEKLDGVFGKTEEAVDKSKKKSDKKLKKIDITDRDARKGLEEAAKKMEGGLSKIFGGTKSSLGDLMSTTNNFFDSVKTGSFNSSEEMKLGLIDSLRAAGIDVDNLDGMSGKMFKQIIGKSDEIFNKLATEDEDKGFKKFKTVASSEMEAVEKTIEKLDTNLVKLGNKKIKVNVGWNVDRFPNRKGGAEEPAGNYANGTFGWITTPSHFIVGEGGEPELLESIGGRTRITPVSRIPKIRAEGSAQRSGSAGRGGSNIYNINVNSGVTKQDKTNFAETMKSIIRDNFRGTATELRTKVG